MRIGYDGGQKKSIFWAKHLLLIAGVVSLAIVVKVETTATAKPVAQMHVYSATPTGQDPRTTRLSRFLSGLHCPVATLAGEFVHAADDNHLDWRLLPSIAVVESGGGKDYRNNNIFGWDRGDQSFPTVRTGLEQVAFKLGRSPQYTKQDLWGKLRLYNPDENYAFMVMWVMKRISPVADLKPHVDRVVRRQSEYVYVD